jgi:signal transduction histidine kinase
MVILKNRLSFPSFWKKLSGSSLDQDEMNNILKDNIFISRTDWLIRHRWITVVIVVIATVIARYVLKMPINEVGLFLGAIALIIINLISIYIKKKIIQKEEEKININLKKLLNFQVPADLLILVVLIHFSGGIENPLFVFCVFHPVNASLFLSVIETYLQTLLVIFFFATMAFLEYFGLISHYDLQFGGFFDVNYYSNPNTVTLIVVIFGITMLMLAYLSTTIGKRLRDQEKSLREAIDKLNEKDKIKNEYVVEVSHEVKGHLTAILSCLDVVLSTNNNNEDEDNSKEYFLKRAYQRAKQLSIFVKDLLKLTKIRMDQQLVMELIPMQELLLQIIGSQKSNASEKSINLTANCQVGQYTFYGNKLMIEEALNNLISNAIKYTPKNGEVKLECQQKENILVIKIFDTGIGIPPEEIPRIFEEFYRASNVAKDSETGTGMGLSIVKQIIDRHNGKIYVESKLGEGSVFTVELPIKTK